MSDDKRLAELEHLIEEFKHSGLRELQARCGDFEIFLSQEADAAGLEGTVKVQAQQHATPTAASDAPADSVSVASQPPHEDWPEDAVVVRAPYLGTFYRSPKPGSPAYVEIGSPVTDDSELCLVEVMKLFTAVRAGVAGTVAQVLASDGDLVVADQPLFVVTPG